MQKDEFHSDKATVYAVLSPPPSAPQLPAEKGIFPPCNGNDVFLNVNVGRGERWMNAMFVTFIAISIVLLIILTRGGILHPPIIILGMLAILGIVFVIFLLNPQYPPMRLNRMTREAYYYDGHTLYREAWETLPVRITIFYSAFTNYFLQFGFRRPGKGPLWLTVGGGYLETAHRHWAFYSGYMEKGFALEMVEVPYQDYSAARKSQYSLFTKAIFILVAPFSVFDYAGNWLNNMTWLSLRPRIRYPQEIIDVCENHPALEAEHDIKGTGG